jgi:hypothetical protein
MAELHFRTLEVTSQLQSSENIWLSAVGGECDLLYDSLGGSSYLNLDT